MTHFVLERSVQAAREILAVDTRFVLNAEQWEAFCAVLDRPARDIPALRRLLSKPTLLAGWAFPLEGGLPHRSAPSGARIRLWLPAPRQYLERFAMSNDRSDGARTFVALQGDRVVGCFSLAASSMEFGDAPQRLVRGLARHPVPCVEPAIGAFIFAEIRKIHRCVVLDRPAEML